MRDHDQVTDDLVFTDPWDDLRGRGPDEQHRRQALAAELATELSPGHPLHGRQVTILGASGARDDILIALATGGWAKVHLTWAGKPEQSPWPSTRFYRTTQEVEEDLDE